MRERVTVVSLSVCQHLISKTMAFSLLKVASTELGDDLSPLNVALFFEKRPYLGEKKSVNFAHSTSTTRYTAHLGSHAECYEIYLMTTITDCWDGALRSSSVANRTQR